LVNYFVADKGEADYASNGGLAVAVGTVGGETRIASGGDAPGVTLWRLSGNRGRTIKFKAHVTALAFGSIGDRVVLAAGGTGESAALYDPATKERLVTLRESPDVAAIYVQSIAIGSLDGKPIVAVGRANSLELWDGTEGRRLGRFAGDGTGLALGTIAGRSVLAGSAGPELRIWDASTYKRIATLPHPAPVTCATLLGHLLVTGDEAGTVHLWDALSGRRRSTLGAFARSVYAVAAATFADGTYVYAQAQSGRVTACRLGAITRP
jgi:WD40 repeat protein